MRKITIDPSNKYIQICGKYRYDTQNGYGNLFSCSKRKIYNDMLSMGRKEESILDAIDNYNAELDLAISNMRKGL